MKKIFLPVAIAIAVGTVGCKPQPKEETVIVSETVKTSGESDLFVPVESNVYRATETVQTDLVSTKLEVSFDWANSQLKGKETLTAKPHFYPKNQLILDAKSMEIKSVILGGKPLKFTYADDVLTIELDKTYKRDEHYTVVIDYIAKPEERAAGGSAAITSDKGLYFINPKGDDPSKMPQIWTQGETEASSVWFPTIDSPNAKTTQEMFITVDDKYVTLSNGKLLDSKKNADGTRTDHWKQDLPHAPYLFMMGVGEFKVVKDTYKRPDGTTMEVNYYVEPAWEQYARAIFGETPKMIEYFSRITGVEYPWDKYSQIIVRDYVSGAMENTGAVVFGDFTYKTDRELLDGNDQATIAHELFHHWFGDLVTAESWSNLTLNESWANYSQYLWDEYRFGIDEADYQAIQEADGYYQTAAQAGYHDLVWFEYNSQEEMFDGHSYNKGGRILHMLRNYLGDEAFFAGVKKYLKENAYKPAEFHQLRLAFEDVSGEDLNWFFNQWYLASGHPILTINHSIADGKAVIDVEQTQDFNEFPVFKLPVNVTVFDDNGATVHRVWIDKISNHFEFPYSGTLKNVLFDTEQMLLAKKTEEKDPAFYLHQYYNGKRYAARLDGLVNGLKVKTPEAEKLILDAMKDPFWDIRQTALSKFTRLKDANKTAGIAEVRKIAVSDSVSSVRSAAITVLSSQLSVTELQPILEERIANDRSYTVVTKALTELNKIDPHRAMVLAKGLENEPASSMLVGIAKIYSANGGPEQYPFFERILTTNKLQDFDGISGLNSFTIYISNQEDLVLAKKSISVYRYQAENGGLYIQMFIPQISEYLVDHFNQRIAGYQQEEAEAKKAGNAHAADAARAKVSEAEALIRDLKALVPQETEGGH